MEDNIISSKQGDYLFVKANCDWTTDNARRVVDRSRLEAEKYGVNLILLDLSNWFSPKSEMVRYYSGEYLAENLKPPFKVAAYAKAEHINKFGENAAVNRCANYAIFSQRTDAINWLLNLSK